MNNLIEQNCKRCINYEICQSSGCQIKKDIEYLQNQLKQRDEVIEEAIKFIQEHTKVDNGLQLEVYDYNVAKLLEILNKKEQLNCS